MALKKLREMRAFLSANEINDSIHKVADINGDEDGTADAIATRNHGKRRHPAYYAMYTNSLLVNEKMITFPEIANVSELRAVVRSVYWLNNQKTIAVKEGGLASNYVEHDHNAENDTREQISLAFEAMKSCNLLSSNELDSRRSKREFSIRVRMGKQQQRNTNNDDDDSRSCGDVKDALVPEEEFPEVIFHVGQVIQHKRKNWRGIIVGWTIKNVMNDNSRLSSLTTKQYLVNVDTACSAANSNLGDNSVMKSPVQYTVLVDSNDASLLRCSDTVSIESQDDLIAVEDPL